MHLTFALPAVFAIVPVFVDAARPPLARSKLFARQGSVPTLPGGSGWGTCEGTCQKWENDLLACSNATATATATDEDAVMQCYCTDSYMTEMTQCYDCLAPLVAQAGSDPTFVSDAQGAINDMEDACAQVGASVASQTVVAASGATAAATTGGGSGSNTAVTAASAGQTAASGSSTGGAASPSKPAGASGSSSALGISAGLSVAVLSGAVGVILAALAA
ncbi:hypothetical protein PHLGIDRAFT_122125 [Phlebiopsis gigantea 11061_1 CR5-6]|uniref:Extracellular membrane protein CFEM domain-containing protein n=1 Tax=Phlebiopsis gigantea (strain 11061_1 CR5-6) TaxID=745531 RepID=A0A0C3PCI7_PHLG1|nr:hypothetical protein PHLGIDRAFT_122125 [Phlebiopsis gigantea 11061_1 CR5-6]